jgi:hypothetical protein
LWAVLIASVCRGQVDLLTVQEASVLVAEIPQVAAATAAGECPSASAQLWDEGKFLIQVRTQCGPRLSESNLISNYMVDRWTSLVTVGESTDEVRSAAMDAKRDGLLKAARARLLSETEAACLVAAYADDRYGPEQGGRAIDRSNALLATITFRISGVTGNVRYMDDVSVDRASGSMVNEQTGMPVASRRVGDVLGKMLAIRFHAGLPLEALGKIALAAPELAGAQCGPIDISDSGVGEEVLVWRACPAESQARVAALVNRNTGRLRAVGGNAEIGGEAAKSAAGLALAEQARKKARIAEELAAYCRTIAAER